MSSNEPLQPPDHTPPSPHTNALATTAIAPSLNATAFTTSLYATATTHPTDESSSSAQAENSSSIHTAVSSPSLSQQESLAFDGVSSVPLGWEEDELFWLSQSPQIQEEEPTLLQAAGLSGKTRWLYILSNPFWLLVLCAVSLTIFTFSIDLYLQNRPMRREHPPVASGARELARESNRPKPQRPVPRYPQLKKRIQRLVHAPLPPPYTPLRALFTPKATPRPHDWLALQYEDGQSWPEYTASQPIRPTPKRKIIYLQPLGKMSPSHRRAVEAVARYMGAFFCSPIKIRPALESIPLPTWAVRQNDFGDQQLHTGYLLFHILKPALPKDALMSLALTQHDLWPGMGWSYVFGMASLKERVGIWSMARYGDPSRSHDAFRLLLQRTLKTALHEAGHILSIPHCIAHDCLMNGSNHLEEADRHPLHLCPHCMAKLCWNLPCNPKKRLKRLHKIALELHLHDLAQHHLHLLQHLK